MSARAAAQRRQQHPANVRRRVAGLHTVGPEIKLDLRHWPRPAIERYSKAPKPKHVTPQLQAQRTAWRAGNPWRPDWVATATAQRAAYELMQEENAV